MSKLHIAFCGQIRTPRLFERSLRKAADMIDQGLVRGVVIATWASEIEAHRSLFDRIRHPAIQVVELHPPSNVPVPHSYFHQMTVLYGALRTLPADALVFKTRPDILFNLDALPDLAQRLLDAPPPSRDPFVFERRVWVPQFEATGPFCINDILFLATRHDAMQLCNFDMSFELNNFFFGKPERSLPNVPSSAEIRRYLHPFARHFPLLEEYGEMVHLCYGGQPNRVGVQSHNLTSPIYWQYVALYFWVLHNYFLIGRPHYEGPIALVRREDPVDDGFGLVGADHYTNCVDPTLFIDNFRTRCDGLGLLYCNTQAWTDAIFAGALADPAARVLILENVEVARGFSPSPARSEEFHRYRAGLIARAGYSGLLD